MKRLVLTFGLLFSLSLASARGDDPKPSAAETEVRASDEAFVKAYNAGDFKALAAMFTDDAEAVDEFGDTVQGRDAVEKVYESLFQARKGWKLEIKLDSLRIARPDLALETGRSRLTPPDGGAPEDSRFSAVMVKQDGRWLQTYVRELSESYDAPKDRLKDLGWLLGEWVDESRAAVVDVTCSKSKDEHYLLMDFTTKIAGEIEMTVEQRIGWDPLTRQFKSWVFDSEGGHSEGLWSRAGKENRWVVKTTGVLADGKLVTATHVYEVDGKHRVHFHSIDRTVGGEAIPDGERVTYARKPPTPGDTGGR